jgi:splicing factor U2AF 35 kDa subunit
LCVRVCVCVYCIRLLSLRYVVDTVIHALTIRKHPKTFTSIISYIYACMYVCMYIQVFEELEKFGKIEELNVCANLGDHMIGNVYVKYEEEEMAEKALNALNGRFYAGRLIMAEYSPVTDFRESRCRQYEESSCKYGGHCNFMHIKRPSRDVCKRLGIRTTYEAARGGGGL